MYCAKFYKCLLDKLQTDFDRINLLIFINNRINWLVSVNVKLTALNAIQVAVW
jgi:hypothetical protein